MFARYRTESTFEEIPIIDLRDATNPDLQARKALAARLRDACINVGFFYVSNHGIPESVIDGALGAAKRFFALPSSTKEELDIHKSPNFKGYTGLLKENTNPQNQGDLHEGFDVGWEDPVTLAARDEGGLDGENVWPEGLPGFRETVMDYYHTTIALGRRLFPLFALALNVDEHFFDDKITKPAAIMRLLYYPPQTESIEGINLQAGPVEGIGAHTDYECFTILWQDNVQALQVLNANGQWVNAVPIHGTLVINIGDQLARWTNDMFKSTVHRAVNRSGVERYSIPLFFGSNYDVKLEAIPSCCSEEFPQKYPVVTAGEYVKSRLEETYAHFKK